MTPDELIAMLTKALRAVDPNECLSTGWMEQRHEALAAAEAHARAEGGERRTYWEVEFILPTEGTNWRVNDSEIPSLAESQESLKRALRRQKDGKADSTALFRIVRVDETRTVVEPDAIAATKHAADCRGMLLGPGGWRLLGTCTCGAKAEVK